MSARKDQLTSQLFPWTKKGYKTKNVTMLQEMTSPLTILYSFSGGWDNCNQRARVLYDASFCREDMTRPEPELDDFNNFFIVKSKVSQLRIINDPIAK